MTSSERRALGWTRSVPPTVPSASGSSRKPVSASPSRRQIDSGRYVPLRAANACAPASTARQSLPVAITTASMPFMMPLLWVAARYGSSSAKREALTMPSITAWPSI